MIDDARGESGFLDRADAGRALAALLPAIVREPGTIVLALPRGGVPVAAEVARALGAPLDVLVVRKLGVPGHEELAMGALAGGGEPLLNPDVIEAFGVTPAVVAWVAEKERRELERREAAYREGRPAPDVRGRTVVVVDDGLATGASMRAAIEALRARQPARIVVAVPVAAAAVCAELRPLVDALVCTVTPEPFESVGRWYRDFSQTTDDEVRARLAGAREGGTP